MAYQLKTTGIAANCTTCIAVDPDTSTVKDFASSSVTSTMVVGGSVTIASQSWDGNTRYYFQAGSGTADADFVKFVTNKPGYVFDTGSQQLSLVYIGEAAGAIRAFGENSSVYFAGQNLSSGTDNCPTLSHSSAISGNFTIPASGDKVIFGFSLVRGTSATAYKAAHDAASMSTVAASGLANNGTIAMDYVGRRDDSTTHLRDKCHAILIFNTALSEANWDSLRDDWFTVLLESAGGSSVGAARNYYSQLRRGF